MKLKYMSGVLSLMMLSGCIGNQPDVQPTISLEQALIDTVDALAAAKAEGQLKKTNFGVYPCTVTAVYNISATRTVDNKVGIGLSGGPPAAIAPISLNLSGSNETTQASTRGNTVTLVLGTAYCLPQAAGASGAGGAAPAGGGKAPAGKVGAAVPAPNKADSLFSGPIAPPPLFGD